MTTSIGVQVSSAEATTYAAQLAGYASITYTSVRWGLVQPGGGSDVANAGLETAGAGAPDLFASWNETASNGAIEDTATCKWGTHAVKLTQGAAQATEICPIDVEVTAETLYTLTFWTRGAGGYGGRYRVYDVSNAADIIATTPTGVTGNTYAQVQVDFTTPAGCVLVRIYFKPGASAGTIAYFDDVTLAAYDWNVAYGGLAGFDDQVAAFVAAGLEPMVHIQAWIAGAPGYPVNPAAYCAWVTALVAKYKTDVHHWAIENEASASGTWGGTPAEYGALLQLAYPIIKAADATAVVEESGTSSTALKIRRAYTYYVNDEDALCTALLAYADLTALLWDPAWDYSDLAVFFARADITEIIDTVNEVYAKAAFFDSLQVHWYGASNWMSEVIGWYVDSLYAGAKPFTVWELGTYIITGNELSDTVLSRYVSSELLTAAGLGATHIIYLPYVGRVVPGYPLKSHMGLLTAAGAARQARTTYRTVETKLDGFTAAAAETTWPGVNVYLYTIPAGDVRGLWTTGGTNTIKLPTFPPVPMAVTYAADGTVCYACSNSIAVGIEPVLAEVF